MNTVRPAAPARLRTLIVDDEPLARAVLADLIRPETDIELVGQAGDGRSALAAIEHLRPDLVLLDVQMPGGTGLEVLRSLAPGRRPAVIFTTAHDRFALPAFDLHAVDYLLKPISAPRLREALARVRQQWQAGQIEALARRIDALVAHLAAAPVPPAPTQLSVKSGADIQLFHPEEIKWVEAQGDYLKIHGTHRSALTRETMKRFLSRVPAGRFARVHKSTIVNLSFVHRLQGIHSGDYRLELKDGTVLRVSRNHWDDLARYLATGA